MKGNEMLHKSFFRSEQKSLIIILFKSCASPLLPLLHMHKKKKKQRDGQLRVITSK